MHNKKWKKFDKLTEKCYNNMIGAEKDGSCWLQAFELMREIVLEERRENPGYASELEMLEEETDYAFDIQGWLEDCMDELDMRGEYDALLRVCEVLLDMFGWPEYTGTDIKFRKSAVLGALGREREAAKFCKEWMHKEPENIWAVAAGVYAYIGTKEFAAAEELINRFIFDQTECSEENDVLFIAASRLYEVTGNKKAKKRMDDALEEYDAALEAYFEEYDPEEDDEFDDEFDEEDLPF